MNFFRTIKSRLGVHLRSDAFEIQLGLLHTALNRTQMNSIPRPLWDYEVHIYSQWGEDGILDFLCSSLNMNKPRVLEFGVGDFTECNSRFLFHSRCAAVFAVDLNPKLESNIHNLVELWKGTLIAKCVEITVENVGEIQALAQEKLGRIDILSIDIDGNDYWIVKAMNLDTIRVVVVEYNPIFGCNALATVPYQDLNRFERHYSGLLFGASIRAWIALLEERGFEFVGSNKVGNNAFFVRRDEVKMLNLLLPNKEHLDDYVDFLIREHRSVEGELTYSSIFETYTEICGEVIFDISRDENVLLQDMEL